VDRSASVGPTTQFLWLVDNFLYGKPTRKPKQKVFMDKGHSLAFLGSVLATGLVGPVTLSAAPSGHRPPALRQKP